MTSDQTRPRTDSSAINTPIIVAARLLACYGLALVALGATTTRDSVYRTAYRSISTIPCVPGAHSSSRITECSTRCPPKR
jgi:hypothetical protein